MLVTYQATLLSKERLTETVTYLHFSLPDIPNWTYQAGQYMIFHLPMEEKGHPARRLYSIASSPHHNQSLDFLIESVKGGLGSGYICDLPVGATQTLQGPAGVFSFRTTDHKDIVMLATGTGIAPMYSMLPSVLEHAPDYHVVLLWGLKYEKEIYLEQELDSLTKQFRNFSYTICLSREERTSRAHCTTGRISTPLQHILTKKKVGQTDFYLCGGPSVIESLKTVLREAFIPQECIFSEKFT